MSDTGTDVGFPTVPDNGGDGGGRLAEIRQISRNDPDAYNANKALQAEHMALLERRSTGVATQDATRTDADTAVQVRIQDAAGAVLATVPNAADLEASFTRLPDDLQAVFLHGMTHDVSGVSAPSAQDVATFASRPEGAALIREWGSTASAHLGRFNARCARIMQTVPAAHADAFVQWVYERDPEEARAIARELGR